MLVDPLQVGGDSRADARLVLLGALGPAADDGDEGGDLAVLVQGPDRAAAVALARVLLSIVRELYAI